MARNIRLTLDNKGEKNVCSVIMLPFQASYEGKVFGKCPFFEKQTAATNDFRPLHPASL